jgi:hypothetical protein
MIILVTGMMRTGTSLTSRQLHRLGVPMGTAMRFPLAQENGQDDWEDIAFTDMMLDHLTQKVDKPIFEHISGYVTWRRQGSEIWGMKSPFALPFVDAIRNAIEDEVKVVLCTRAIHETYDSLKAQTSEPFLIHVQDLLLESLDKVKCDLVIDHSEHSDSPDGVKAKLEALIRS